MTLLATGTVKSSLKILPLYFRSVVFSTTDLIFLVRARLVFFDRDLVERARLVRLGRPRVLLRRLYMMESVL